MDQKREFRKLHLSDLELVLQMENGFRKGFIFEENARRFLANPMNWIFACIQEKQIIGFACGYELNRLDSKGNMLYIHEIGVLPQYQKQGIGFQILTGIKNLCRLTGICIFFYLHRNIMLLLVHYMKKLVVKKQVMLMMMTRPISLISLTNFQ